MTEPNTGNWIRGILIRGVGGLYGVRPLPLAAGDGVLLCRARGVFRHENISPLPGDEVICLPSGGDDKANRDAAYVIDRILPRKNSLIRPPLANLTHLFLVIPAARPEPDLRTADALLSVAEANGIAPVVLVTKRDLAPARAEEICALYAGAGYPAVTLSSADAASVDALRAFIVSLAADGATVTAAFAGASGAGKSTLMTKLFPRHTFKTGDVSRKTERGRQTTRHVELFPFEADGSVCLIADTPGFSLLDFTQYNALDTAALPGTFPEFRPYLGQCRYTKCTHTKEEGCAILAAVRAGAVSPARHESYRAMFDECKKTPDWKRRRMERNDRHG